MSLRFRNTLTGRSEPFEPLEPGHVRMYTCGPTVYAPAHVGNFRSFVFADVLRRTLLFSGLRVTWVMNITDVDDKIIRDAAAAGIPIDELTTRYTAVFLEDLARLGIALPDVMPRATDHIDDMVRLIETLIGKGHAYPTEDGSVFFRIASWPAYGRLARLDPAQQRSGERVEADEYEKDDVRDFALWKAAKPGEPSWDTALGPGRPGWHIECSAMSMRYLGESFDVHTGGIDLIFPHHEDEIAQSEAATGEPFVHTWMHCAHLHMQGEKMAKRTGNFARPADVYTAGISPRVLRYALLATHYRSPLEFSDGSLAHAGAALERFSTAVSALDAYTEERADDASLPGLLADAHVAFAAGLEDDLNVSAALAALFDLVRELNSRVALRSISTADARRAAAQLRELDGVLGVLEDAAHELPADHAALLDERSAARAARDWARSDALREELAAAGIGVEDTPDGQRWRRIERRMKRDRGDERESSGSGKPRGKSRGGGASHGGPSRSPGGGPSHDRGSRPPGSRRPGTDGGRSGAGHGGPSGASGARSSGRDKPEGGSTSERRETGGPSSARQRFDGPPGGRRSTGREPGPDRSISWRRAGEGDRRHGPGDADRPDRPPFDRHEPGDGPPWRRAARFARDPSDRARRPDRDQGGAPKHPGPRPDRPFGRPRPPDGSSDAPARRGPRPPGGPWDRPRPGRPRPARGDHPIVRREADVAARPWSGLVPEDVLRPDEEVVAGRRPVEEAFAARRPALRLLVVPGRRAALDQLVLHATTLRIPVVEVEGGTITAISGFDGHQGVALVVEPRRWATLDEVLALARTRSEPPFVLVLDHLEDPQNVGTLLRSAEAAGVHGVVFPRRGSAPLSPAAVKTSAGATEHLLLVPLDDLPAGLVDLHTRGVRIVGADGEASLTVRELDLRGPLAVVIGSEGRGLDARVRRRVDAMARIPMRGRIGSLNASVAGSIFLFEAATQRDLPEAAPADATSGSEPTLDASVAGSTDAERTDPGPDDRLADAGATGEAAAEGADSHALPEATETGTDDEAALLPEAPTPDDAPGPG